MRRWGYFTCCMLPKARQSVFFNAIKHAGKLTLNKACCKQSGAFMLGTHHTNGTQLVCVVHQFIAREELQLEGHVGRWACG